MRRTDPAKRREAAKDREAAPLLYSKWSEEENTQAKELYAEGGRDRAQFGTDLSAALKGSKNPSQCSKKYDTLNKGAPKTFFVFDYDAGDPTQHTAELIAALPKADRNLGREELERRWWAKVRNMSDERAKKELKNAIDHAFNYFGKDQKFKNTKEYVRVLANSGLPPSFLDLKPPKRNSQVFRRACDQFLRETHWVQVHRDAALAQLAGAPTRCNWGFLLPGEGRS